MKNLNPIYLMEMSLTQKDIMPIGKSASAKAKQLKLTIKKTMPYVEKAKKTVAKFREGVHKGKIKDTGTVKQSPRGKFSAGTGTIKVTALGQ